MATAPNNRWHPRLVEAAMALSQNRLEVAEPLLKAHLKDDPFDVAAIRMLAELAARIGRMRDAETLRRRALEIAPGFTAARANLAMVLGRAGRPFVRLSRAGLPDETSTCSGNSSVSFAAS